MIQGMAGFEYYRAFKGSVNLTVFYSSSIDICMYNEKVLGDSRILKGGRVTIPKKVREKLSVKDGDFLTYLLTSNGFVKIKKLEFDSDKAIKQIEKLKKEKSLLS
jgi:bifunctional DNA-binding transcriptional regulator/antitoxin component of YhaV-PrlF toxin-antitoxin module